MAKRFNGVINTDVRDSVPDWEPYTQPKAPDGAPNVLIILYDDTGLAAWSPFGGRINMPSLQRLADNGLMYSQWHTTALCSPTRSCFLTGRNHHENGYACIAEGATGFPGSNGHIPMENAYLAEVMRQMVGRQPLEVQRDPDPVCRGAAEIAMQLHRNLPRCLSFARHSGAMR